ncbi:MAG: hypothetical protein WC695_10435 [Candidatus Omnitrophota bacterium]
MKTKNNPFVYLFIVLFSLSIGLLFNLSIKIGILISIFITLLLLVFLLTKIFKKFDPFLMLVFLYPLLPFHMGYDVLSGLVPVFRVHRILTVLLLLFWLFKSKSIKESIIAFPLNKIFLLMFVPISFASFFSFSPIASFFYLGSFTIEYFFFAVMIFDLTKEEGVANKLMIIIAISSIIAAIIGVLEYYSGINVYSYIKPFSLGMKYAVTQQIREGSLRIRGAFDHSISFGVYLSLSLAAVVYLFLMSKKIYQKAFYSMAGVFISFAVFLTRSRISILLMFVLIISVLLLKKRKVLFLASFVFMFFLVQPFFFQAQRNEILVLIHSAFMPLTAGSKEMIGSAMMRINQFNEISSLIIKKPIVGYGRIDLNTGSVDSLYLLMALRFGVLACVGFLLVNMFIFRQALSLYIKSRDEKFKVFGLIICSALLGLFFVWAAVSLESYFYLLWIYIGILSRFYLALNKNIKSKKNDI